MNRLISIFISGVIVGLFLSRPLFAAEIWMISLDGQSKSVKNGGSSPSSGYLQLIETLFEDSGNTVIELKSLDALNEQLKQSHPTAFIAFHSRSELPNFPVSPRTKPSPTMVEILIRDVNRQGIPVYVLVPDDSLIPELKRLGISEEKIHEIGRGMRRGELVNGKPVSSDLDFLLRWLDGLGPVDPRPNCREALAAAAASPSPAILTKKASVLTDRSSP